MSTTENTKPVAENKMGTMPVKRLILSMSLPMMISMLVQALYNIVDSIFVARLSEDALTAVTLAFPMQNLMIALGSGTGVGINALLSRSLGKKDYEEASNAANTGIFLNIINYVVFALLGLVIVKPFIASQTDNATIARYGVTYLTWICVLSVGIFFQMTFERLLQSTGMTTLSMVSQLSGAIINMILDPMLIFGIGPFPKLGVAGAAIATVFGQVTAACLGLYLNISKNKEITLSLKSILHPNKQSMKQIYFVGIPSIAMMSIGSIMTYLLNKILGMFSSTAIAVFGVYFKLQSFVFMPIFGLNNGMIPVLSFNYGARKKERIKEALSFSLKFAFSIMLAGSIIFELIPQTLLKLFDASEHMITIGVPALRIIAIHFPIAAICISFGSMFQAFAKSTYSLVISLARQLIALIPAAWLLAQTGNLNYVWFAFLIAEIMSLTMTMIFYRKIHREIIETL
ncbi:MAG: MATE family efflux transporter [Lachnospiraceae bacterium]|nr:MATE family efflux transporter [Lachnospiraceae bacterium]